MSTRNRLFGWAASAIAGMLLVGLSGYFMSLGLARADMVGSAISAVAGLAGLCLSAYGLLTARRTRQPDQQLAQPNPVIATGERAVGSASGGQPVVTGDGNVVSWGDVRV
ncbi:MAG TPA: hypothetical protein VFM55_21495 [Micromonosporaceae bacterium]|nr:hypothetical protein [Micromonosporaceae bacterium]